MNKKERLQAWLKEVQQHLYEELLPFWQTHGVEPQYGGYLTYLDEKGTPTGETDKTVVCQTRNGLFLFFGVARGVWPILLMRGSPVRASSSS